MYSTCVSSKLCEFILFDLSNFPLLGISSHLLQRWLGLLCSSCAAGRFLPRLLCNSFHWKLLPSGHCLVSSLCFPEEMMFLACLTLSVSTSLKCSLYSAPPEWIALVVLLLLCIALGLHHIWWETPLVRTGSRDPWQLLNAMGKMQILVLAVLRKHLEILPKSGLGFLSSAATTNISCSLASNKGEYKEHLSLKMVWVKMTERAKMNEFTNFTRLASFISDRLLKLSGPPRKSGFFQERGRKRVKEWGDVTFMKEWVKALDKTRILAPADIKFVVSFPRYGHLKIPKGPNQISLVYFRAS